MFVSRRLARNGRLWRSVRLCIAASIIVACLDLFRELLRSHPPPSPKASAQDLSHINSVYIASIQYNSEGVLTAGWIPSLLQLIEELQVVNITVFISIYESGSVDGTKTALSGLEDSLKTLGVDHEIRLDTETHALAIEKSLSSSTGLLHTLYGKELRRIIYLADVRNRALEPLEAFSKAGVKFDKLLYLNDVVFSAEDVISLLNTRNGNYGAVCGLDFMNPPWNHVSGRASLHPPGIYDDFATRDSDGHVLGAHLYPYFLSRKSKAALLSRKPVPVQSCWNGLVAFDAQPFQSTSNPLRFRSIPDSLAAYHLEASECCLVHYDNPLSLAAGVWINPAVLVGYSIEAYAAVTGGEWPTMHELRWGNWKSRWIWPWLRDPIPSLKTAWRIWRWRMGHPDVDEPGLACVQDLAMVLTAEGWRLRGARFE